MLRLRIATRKSPLALEQARFIAERICHLDRRLSVELIPMNTRGDIVLDRSLAIIGGKGLFLKELEQALLRHSADCAVHSLKDMPMDLDDAFCVPAILAREDPSDAFVSNHYAHWTELPPGARVGTSSPRRHALIRALRSDLQIDDLRGNINTRLAKLDAGQYAAIVLASAGLMRLGHFKRVTQRLPLPQWLPAPGQGALAIQCRQDAPEVVALLSELNEARLCQAVQAERAMSRYLSGSCHVAIGAYAVASAVGLTLHGMVGQARTGHILRADHCLQADAQTLGRVVAQRLLDQGAQRLITPPPSDESLNR